MVKVALVTGGGRTIGAAAADVLATRGFTVAVTDRDVAAAEAKAGQLPGSGHRAVELDVMDETSVASAFAEVERDIGPVAVLVSCVGGMVTSHSSNVGLTGMDVRDWDLTHALNARGTFLVLREMLRRRRSQPVPNGRIVTIASIAGQLAWNPTGCHYTTSKAAMISLTKFAAVEAAALNITVNIIAPGAIDGPNFRASLTEGQIEALIETTPIRRLGSASEVASAIAWLISDEAGYITGATIDVNGGRRMA